LLHVETQETELNFAAVISSQNDLYCVRWDIKLYLLTHSLVCIHIISCVLNMLVFTAGVFLM